MLVCKLHPASSSHVFVDHLFICYTGQEAEEALLLVVDDNWFCHILVLSHLYEKQKCQYLHFCSAGQLQVPALERFQIGRSSQCKVTKHSQAVWTGFSYLCASDLLCHVSCVVSKGCTHKDTFLIPSYARMKPKVRHFIFLPRVALPEAFRRW